jgi:putative transcriptional regulator
MLLVATPTLTDPSFAGSVVLLLDVDDGALGVVLNRPSAVPVPAALPGWADVVDEPEVLFRGGPVSTEGALAVGLLREADPTAETPVGFRSVDGPLGLVDLDAPRELLAGALARLRIFAGYAGWGEGQLEGEVEQGAWYVVPGNHADAFRADTTHLWRDVLRRQPGELAWLSTRPADTTLN